MAYTATTLATLQTALSQRLNDVTSVFWPSAELTFALNQALQLWNLLTGDNRVWYALPLDPAVVWYDLQGGTGSPRLATVTDADIFAQLQILLMEGTTPATVATTQFTLADFYTAIQAKRDEFLLRTQCTRQVRPLVVTPNVETLALPPTVIDAVRAYWLPDAPDGIPGYLAKSDEFTTLAFQSFAPLTPSDPITYTSGMDSPLTVRLVPPPANPGTVEFITVETQATLPQQSATTLDIANDLTPGIMWGALAYLLSISLEAADVQRAQYAASRFEHYIELAQAFPAVLSARINNTPMFVDAIETLDSFSPDWRVVQDVPSVVGLAGLNLLALPTSEAQTVTIQVVANATQLAAGTDVVQLGQEVIDALLDYAQHILSFKMGGQDFISTLPLMKSIVQTAAKRNQIVAGLSMYAEIMKSRNARANDFEVPSTEEVDG